MGPSESVSQTELPVSVVSDVENPFAHLSERKKHFILNMEDDFRSTDRPYACLQFTDGKTFDRAMEIAGILITRGWNVTLAKEGFIVDMASKLDA